MAQILHGVGGMKLSEAIVEQARFQIQRDAPSCSTSSAHTGITARMEASIALSDDGDFLFPSIRLNGTKPLSPDSLLRKRIRPALKRVGIEGKIIGWHNFRHTLGYASSVDRRGYQSGTGFTASCQQPTHARHLYSRRFAAEARCQHQGSGTATTGTGFEGSAPSPL
jgi:hypothetical protein